MLLHKDGDSGSGSCLPFKLDTSTVQVIEVRSYFAGYFLCTFFSCMCLMMNVEGTAYVRLLFT